MFKVQCLKFGSTIQLCITNYCILRLITSIQAFGFQEKRGLLPALRLT